MSPFAQDKSLVIDLEVNPAKADEIFKVAALREDRDVALEFDVNKDLPQVLAQVDDLANGADYLLGHNVINHDLRILRQQASNMLLHELPAVDTLRLSPLAFPRNPYHRLVKDYKLVRDTLNSPLADCRLTLTLFNDQRQAFAELHRAEPDELLCYQALLAPTPERDAGGLFASLTGRTAVAVEEIAPLIERQLVEKDPHTHRDLKVCRTRLDTLLAEDLHDEKAHLPLAYVLAWLRVSGGNSVLAPWVRHQFPKVGALIRELRDRPCGRDDCRYCQTTHNPRHELQRYFNYADFRQEPSGKSLQHDITLAGMQGKHVLAVLATGGGKSITYQLPALNRFHRNASLTVVISPLQSLMKDQVDGLLKKGVNCAAAFNGLLTMPERADVLDKIRLGDIGIVLVSPEQFRSRAFCSAIEQREVGGWVFDEAHCLSKWGNDFRPDYHYVSRYIAKYHAGRKPAPIGCFTATAKPQVLADIRAHFKDALNVRFQEFLGSHERSNLRLEVMPCTRAEKWPRVHRLLEEVLSQQPGAAVVFVSSRKAAEQLAGFLQQQGLACRHFHAGMKPAEKLEVQAKFKTGAIPIMVATNAFGMGVDKEDVRLVVHADVPGSLENYLQEAGRAGRDQQPALAVLLYDPQDIETQFGLCERACLSHRDIQQIQKKLNSEFRRRGQKELVITAGEIIMDDAIQTSFESDAHDADAKVITAVAWLERGGYLTREENHTQIFPSRPTVTREEAERRLRASTLPERRLAEYLAIYGYLCRASGDDRINTDNLVTLTSLEPQEVAHILKDLEARELLVSDTQFTAVLSNGRTENSMHRLQELLTLEKALLDVMAEQSPEATDGSWQDINVSTLTSGLKVRLARNDILPLHVLRLLRGLSPDRDGNQQPRLNSFDLRQLSHDYIRLSVRHPHGWNGLAAVSTIRGVVASKLLQHLLDKLTARRKNQLVSATFGELVALLDQDLELQQLVPGKREKYVERILLFLHRQEVLCLNHGVTVMRRAMTLKVDLQRPRFLKDDYERLDQHYREKRIQVHVMREYAERAQQDPNAARGLLADYFGSDQASFLRRYFAGREAVLKYATSEASWDSIVLALSDTQRTIVTDDLDSNRLVLAGPGSGKTRVIVHRIAYLLRVRRVPASAIVALTFNRHAANQIRKRLVTLVGADAYGVSVMTYHSLALRLTGTRFERGEETDENTLQHLMKEAVDLLEGSLLMPVEDEGDPPSEDDLDDARANLRASLLRGYRFILVDEYQDIDELQYRLVSALADRGASDEGKPCIVAVGDDDQNIYGWRDTNNRYIEEFRTSYSASDTFLVENYRSSGCIIAAANHVIGLNGQRLKSEAPVRIDARRRADPPGGNWQTLDPHRRGQVLRLLIDRTDEAKGNCQAQAALGELQRLLALENGVWDGCAVLARTHHYLATVQAWCEHHGVPYHLAADKDNGLPMIRQRTFVAAIDCLDRQTQALTAEQALQCIQGVLDEHSAAFFEIAFDELAGELGECQLQSASIVAWLYDYAREIRRQPTSGLYLGTVHSAKGLEFRHVALLDGGWKSKGTELDDERRLYYVGMTRAEQTLTLCEFSADNAFSGSLPVEIACESFNGPPLPELDKRYLQLSLKDIDLGYAGRQDATRDIHSALARLRRGDPLSMHKEQNSARYLMLDSTGTVVGRTANAFKPEFDMQVCEVADILVRYAEDSDEAFRGYCKCDQWAVVVPRVCGVPGKKARETQPTTDTDQELVSG
ncbi:RecQ family ATP-dependent DNA helicase [Pseudomonas sp. S75]|uniref:RecQ family ATP-dependent DNA helicase n=1 Tax=unclassified Pseudomonas TaxID=196821 RepID=UPI001905B8C2|nr:MULTISPECIES: RecQ family ATP-dependent DNA helicase [unclassified Pseudomonas]MBJ9976330.1 RecQ family ATP-dependent DNA helicase [Pseudomonas sp. S30]MBK0154558.1 RecQ family ATP-dependent DNA helicase [Pseudomonas sp. S75]